MKKGTFHEVLTRETTHMSELSKQAATLSQTTPHDLMDIWFLVQEVKEMAHTLCCTISMQRNVYRSLPSDLLFSIAKFNAVPSLRDLGKICRSWKTVTEKRSYASQWTGTLFSKSLRPSPVALLEFSWMPSPNALPPDVTSSMCTLIAFSETQGIEIRNRHSLVHRKIRDWKLEQTRDIVTDSSFVKRVMAVHLTDCSLRLVVEERQDECVYFVEITRHFDGSFSPHKTSRGVLKESFAAMLCHTWSSCSFFGLFQESFPDLLIIEYNFEKCQRLRSYDISTFFTNHDTDQIIDSTYMTWYAGLLIVISQNEVTKEISKDDVLSPDPPHNDWLLEVIVLDWESKQHVGLPTIPRSNYSSVYEELLVALQVFGHPLVYLSMDCTQKIGNRLHVWGDAVSTASKKRKVVERNDTCESF